MCLCIHIILLLLLTDRPYVLLLFLYIAAATMYIKYKEYMMDCFMKSELVVPFIVISRMSWARQWY